jgi:hypothetical protein
MSQSLGRPTMTGVAWSKPATAAGDFFVLAGETFAAMCRPAYHDGGDGSRHATPEWTALTHTVWPIAISSCPGA